MGDAPNRIHELRRAANLSQEGLGLLVGVSKMHISGLERGQRELYLGLMRRLAGALGVSTVDILGKIDNPPATPQAMPLKLGDDGSGNGNGRQGNR